MQIEKFRVKNYRSIIDSGDCYLSPKITVLAGKNETGKTSILEALRDFTKSESIQEEARPIRRKKDPEIHVTFTISQEEMKDLIPENVTIPSEKSQVTIAKTYRKGYEIRNIKDFLPEFEREKSKITKRAEEDLIPKAKNFISQTKRELSFDKDALLKEKIQEEKNVINDLKQEDDVDEEKAETLIGDLEELENELKEIENLGDKFVENVKSKMPDFVLFSTYEDQIPNNIPFDDLENSEFVEDLAQVSNLNASLLKKSKDDRRKREHKTEVNIELNEDYQEFWTQDETTLSIDWDSDNLKFWIEEDEIPYEPKLRSKGKMWHLSFYIKLTAHASKENPPVVLIDDPGLHLHAKAQKDILKKLESVGETSRVIYSTHSPYLIHSEKLDRVWLVRREEGEGTEIEKLHAGADKDTLRPILTAIGADTTIGVHTDKENSVIVEGISDYHYLQAFRERVSWEEDLDIIPGTGGDSPVHIGSILFGWGVKPIFLLDDDDQGDNITEKLEEDLDIDEERIIRIPVENGAVEDVFTKADFREYVLQDEAPPEYNSSNSEYLKPNRGDKDKVLLAKKFYELVRNEEELDLNRETEENIQKIFDRLSRVIE